MSALASLVLATAIGCGDSPARDDERLREFRRDGQALCREALRAAGEPTGSAPRALARWLRGALAASDELAQRLEALDPPASLERTMQMALELEDRDDAVWRGVVQRLERGASLERALAPDAAELARNRRRGDRLYRRLGLSACTANAAGANSI